MSSGQQQTYRRCWITRRTRKDGYSYQLRWYDRNGKMRKQTVARNKKRAEQLRTQKEHELNTQPDLLPRTLSQFVAEYTEARRQQVRLATAREEERVLRYFLEATGDVPLADICPRHVEQYLQARLSGFNGHRAVTPASVNKDLAHLKAIFNGAIRLGYLRENPCRGRKMFRVPEREMRTLSRDEATKLLRAAEQMDGLAGTWWPRLIRLALSTGLRRNEMLALRWRDIDLEHSLLTVANRDGHLTKSGKQRTIPLSDEITAELRRWRAEEAEHSIGDVAEQPVLVFAHRRPGWVSEQWNKVIDKTDMEPCTLHDLRRTYITWLVEAGVSMPTVQRLAGHSSITVTARFYAHVTGMEMTEAASRLPSLSTQSARNRPDVKDRQSEQVPETYPEDV